MAAAPSGSHDSITQFDSNLSVNVKSSKPSLSRSKSVKQSIAKGASSFFGLPTDEEDEKSKAWAERRWRHVSRRLGKMKEDAAAGPVGSALDVTDGGLRFASVVTQVMETRSAFHAVNLKKESAASILWKTAHKKFAGKPTDLSTVFTFGGRSFAPADLTEGDDDTVFADYFDQEQKFRRSPRTPIPTPSAAPLTAGFGLGDDRSFFKFDVDDEGFDEVDAPVPSAPSTGVPSAPITPTLGMLFGFDKERRQAELDRLRQIARERWQAPMRTVSVHSTGERRNRIHAKPPLARAHKREFGKGLVGNLLNRTFKRSVRLDSDVRKQMEEFYDHRPYFTYWLSFVQVIIVIVTIAVYPFAPVGVAKRQISKEVLFSRNGVLQIENLPKTVVESFWIGPSLQTLILLGAKYAPCMRRDKSLYRLLAEEKKAENGTGCCIQTYNTGCIQRSQKECTSSFTKFVHGKVCGSDPAACLDPLSQAPYVWDQSSITSWPICKKFRNISSLGALEYPQMHCEMTGRPCCIGTQAECIITTQEHCKFKDGIYHKDATLCSQVDCLSSMCGLLPFVNKNIPDQFYRLWLSLFLHAGLLHVVVSLIFNFTIMRDVEKMAGWYRIALIFVLSGIGGNIWSATILPYQAEVGPSGGLFGVLACLFAELFQSWQLIMKPWIALGKLCGLMIVLFLIGLLPYIDNFAHIFGFLYGLFLALALLPYISFGKWDLTRKRVQIGVAIAMLVILSVIGFVLFYDKQEFHTSAIGYFNCVPLSEDFCSNFHQGQTLEPRQGYL